MRLQRLMMGLAVSAAMVALGQTGGFRTDTLAVFPPVDNVLPLTTVAVGDLEGDTRNEMVVVSSLHNAVRVLQVNRDGSWQLVREIAIAGLPNQRDSWAFVSPKIVDMNGDRRKDIVVWQRANDRKGRLVVLTQEQEGVYTMATFATPESSSIYGMAVGDVDRDGLPDVITAEHGWYTRQTTVYVMYNAGDGTRFARVEGRSYPSSCSYVYAVDLNQDGWLEVVASTHPWSGPGVLIARNNGGQLGALELLPGPYAVNQFTAGDVNRDGWVDLVTTDVIPHQFGPSFNIYRSVSGGSYTAPQTIATGEPRSPQIGDFNGDGLPDLAVDRAVAHEIAIYLGDGTTGDLSATPVVVSTPDLLAADHAERGLWESLVMGDADNDGSPDLIFTVNRIVLIHRADGMGPEVREVAAAPSPAAVGTAVTLTAVVDDSGSGGSGIQGAEYRLDGGAWIAMEAGDGAWGSVTENAAAALGAFPSAGVRTLCVRGRDATGNVGAEKCTFLPVYDPAAGFVTGGGAVASPAGADLANPGAEGLAQFGFVAKYESGMTTPSGGVEFHFQAGNLRFKSEQLEWLVVTGEPRAVFRGSGRLANGTLCQFEVDAWDASLAPKGTDGFGMKIHACAGGGERYRLSATELTRGSVVIHRK